MMVFINRLVIKTDQLIRYELLILMALGCIGAVAAFPLSYISSTNILIGLCLFPFMLFISGSPRFNYFYFLGLIIFGALAGLYHLKIFYFFTVAFYIIFLLEFCVGKVNTLILFLTVSMSPVFLQVSAILGFPIRLLLSEWAGDLLRLAGLDILVEGNMMVLNGFSFTVDEACMGLNMLSISLLMGVFVISHHYRASRRALSLKYLLLFFAAVFVLNIISNLFRIMILVTFKILPDNPLHEVIGIAGLVVYVMVPLYFLARAMVQCWGRVISKDLSHEKLKVYTRSMLLALGTLIMVIGFMTNIYREQSEISHAEVRYNGMTPVKLQGGITKMFDGNLLIYVKPIPEFFSGEHTPLICWKGSGFVFKKVVKSKVGTKNIYYGILLKGDEVLHTAWWFTNGTIQTTDQLKWRTMMLSGRERFCLVNVTAKDKESLFKNLEGIFSDNLLTISQ